MAKYMGIVSGIKALIATVQTSAGAGDADKIPSLDSGGKLDITMMPSGIGAPTKVVLASEAIAAGDFVNVYNNAGTLNVRKADASGGHAKRANGFCLASISNGASGTVYLSGTLTGLSGLTPGTKQFLSATPGARTETAPTTTGHYLQALGDSISATEIVFEPDEGVVL